MIFNPNESGPPLIQTIALHTTADLAPRTEMKAKSGAPLAALVLLTCLIAAPGAASASPSSRPQAPTAAAGIPGDSVEADPAGTAESRGEERVPGLRVGGAVVVEGAWSPGSAGLLELAVTSLEARPGGGWTALVEVATKSGRGEARFPSAQGLSSLDADDFLGLGEAWLEWRGGDAARIKIGRVDANTEFAASEVAAGFANPSFGLSPALDFLPSYPTPAPSANGFVRPGRGAPEIGAGVYRAGAGEWSALAQLAGGGAAPGVRWSVGAAAPVGTSSPNESGGSAVGAGAFAILERMAERGPSAFLILAAARGRASRHAAFGLAWSGPAIRRKLERMGVAGVPLTGAGVAASALADADMAGELVAEAYVELTLLQRLLVQPDVQLRLDRSAAPAVGGLLRVTLHP